MSTTIYDTLDGHYDSTRKADPYLTERLLHGLNPLKDGIYLDIGCGTGNYTDALARKGFCFYGIDPSLKMLDQARLRNPDVHWIQGHAEQIPVENNFFDGAIATLTLHHWSYLSQAFLELGRVLKPGANLVLFTSTPEQMNGYWLNHYFPNMLHASSAQMPSLSTLEMAMEDSGLKKIATETYSVQNTLQDHFLYVGKNRPELYFDARIRSGISSFAALANAEEVAHGLKQLDTDLQNGHFERIKTHYANELGDYLFVILQKCAS